jgi:hypothetical protein
VERWIPTAACVLTLEFLVCFSVEASLAAASTLIPLGGVSMVLAAQRNSRYLFLAATPVFFGVQQLCEAAVWHGLECQRTNWIESGAVAFLYFAIAFWPYWIPLAVGWIEERKPWRRMWFGMGAFGFILGLVCYGPAAWNFREWIHVGISGHSVRYDLNRVPIVDSVPSVVWYVLYLSLICGPLLFSFERRLRWLGLLVGASAAIAHFVFQTAFTSVWCFFAALLSVYIGYVIWELPERITAMPDQKIA